MKQEAFKKSTIFWFWALKSIKQAPARACSRLLFSGSNMGAQN